MSSRLICGIQEAIHNKIQYIIMSFSDLNDDEYAKIFADGKAFLNEMHNMSTRELLPMRATNKENRDRINEIIKSAKLYRDSLL